MGCVFPYGDNVYQCIIPERICKEGYKAIHSLYQHCINFEKVKYILEYRNISMAREEDYIITLPALPAGSC